MEYYNTFTVPELQRMAKERHMIVGKQKKAELVAELLAWDEKRRVIDERLRAEEASRLARTSARKQWDIPWHVESLEYPFSFLRSGEYPRECKPIPGHPMEDIGAFPDNIAEYLWAHSGEPDVHPWLCLCRLDTGVHVYFRGECDYTGFDCQGDMQIYAHRDPNILLQMAMTTADYQEYVKDTVELE